MSAATFCRCPACGAALPEAPLTALRAACSPWQASILDIIAAEPGVTFYAIQTRLGMAQSGTQLARLRARIASFGWAIEGPKPGLRGLRLVRLTDGMDRP